MTSTTFDEPEMFFTLADKKGNTINQGGYPVFYGSLDQVHDYLMKRDASMEHLTIKSFSKEQLVEALGEGVTVIYKSPIASGTDPFIQTKLHS